MKEIFSFSQLFRVEGLVNRKATEVVTSFSIIENRSCVSNLKHLRKSNDNEICPTRHNATERSRVGFLKSNPMSCVILVLIAHKTNSNLNLNFDLKLNVFLLVKTDISTRSQNHPLLCSIRHPPNAAYKSLVESSNGNVSWNSGGTNVNAKITPKANHQSLEKVCHCKKLNVTMVSDIVLLKLNVKVTPTTSPNGKIKERIRKVKLRLKLSFRQTTMNIDARLLCSADVESNPGPQPVWPRPVGDDAGSDSGSARLETSTVLVTTYNVRGLKDEKKLRHLINHFNKSVVNKNRDVIVCLQETYLETPGKLPYLWRGNFNLTPGIGHSGGCITLLSSHINIVACSNFGSRGHFLACQKSDDPSISYIIVNIYAPNPNTNEKIEFYKEVFEALEAFEETHQCSNVIVAGDFNLVFAAHEMKNRLHTSQEKKVALVVGDLIKGAGLSDAWAGKKVGLTWNRANSDSFSRIDRILYQSALLKLNFIKENWSLSVSDHAAVETGFSPVNRKFTRRTKIPRIDPDLAKNAETSRKLFDQFNEMFATTPATWDPHMKLEFAKVCIRTIAERLQAERKRTEKLEEETLNEELNETIMILEKAGLTEARTNLLINKAEVLRAKKAALVEEKGRRLAERLGTKWYQEGEKSNRYFMRILNRPTPDDFKTILKDDGTVVETPEGVAKEIGDFYRTLYENYEDIQEESDDSFFANISPISGNSEQNIVKPVTVQELRETLQTCRDSAPGPDGIPYSVLGLLWPVFGELLANAWNHSLLIGKLPLSHKQSFLKLIPKAGKDLRRLTNWRPITLSNCDHKLITKTYANRMCAQLAPNIEERQTAYLKGRLINDNIRSMIATINVAQEEQLDGLLVALDAKKAFDSVSHKYIERCLKSFGCKNFIPIFRLLYAELKTDIIVNGKVEAGFLIKRGVKQGDALSCIIFIMCMEPLLRNIESNDEIVPIISMALNKVLPKSYAYADDVNVTIQDSPRSLRALFSEYERLSRNSGLELNANKTEIMRMSGEGEQAYRATYLNKDVVIMSVPSLKINGIIFQRNADAMEQENVESVCRKMDCQFRRWSKRNLTTLEKILIVKTFGISQAIFLMQSMSISSVSFKKLNALLYKFIWNRHYLAAKAPERIKREIVNTPVKMGGLGMLDIVALDESLKLKALGRLMDTGHPFLCIVKENIKLDQYFKPSIGLQIERVATKGVDLLEKDRAKLWDDPSLCSNVHFLKAVRDTSLRLIVTAQGQRSIQFFNLWSRGARKVKDITLGDLTSLRRHLIPKKVVALTNAVGTRLCDIDNQELKLYRLNSLFKHLGKCTSQEIRTSRTGRDPISEFKIGMLLNKTDTLSWGLKLAKIESTSHKNIILRVSHGDIYTNEKLFRFGLNTDPLCPRCNEIETLRHKFIECEYTKKIWELAFRCSAAVTTSSPLNEDPTQAALGAYMAANGAILTLNAEILQRINALKPENFLLHPKFFIKMALVALLKKEKTGQCKEMLKSILDKLG